MTLNLFDYAVIVHVTSSSPTSLHLEKDWEEMVDVAALVGPCDIKIFDLTCLAKPELPEVKSSQVKFTSVSGTANDL